MTQAPLLEATIREGWTSAYLESRGVPGSSLRLHDASGRYWAVLRFEGLHFYESLDGLDFSSGRKLAQDIDRALVRLTSRARRYVRHTPRSYYPRYEEEGE